MIEIIGKNISLRTMNQKEMRALWRKFEPEANSKINYVYDEEKVDLLFERMQEKDEWNKTVGIFSKSDEVIGELTFKQIVYSEKRCELTLFLATEAHRGKGFGSEAITLALKYAKDELGVTRIYADASSKNIRIQKALKNCGFQHTKTYKGGTSDGGDRMTFVCVL